MMLHRMMIHEDAGTGVTLPKLSLRLHGGMTGATCVLLAKAAEQAGLDGIWFAENAFGRGIFPAAAACAVATSRLRIGAGVFNPFSRHPSMMAMEIGALDELSGGRASISIGSGIASQVARLGHSGEKPLGALRDTLTILRGLIQGQTVDHSGMFSAHKVKLDYKARPDIPIYLAGRGDLSIRLCGSHADGLVISNMCSAGFSARAAQILFESWAASGRSGDPDIIQYVPCAVDEDRDVAIAAAKRAVGAMLPNYWSLAQKNPFARMGFALDTNLDEADIADAAARLASGEDPVSVLDERFTTAFSVAGTPEECLAAASRYAAAHVTELALTVGAVDPQKEISLLAAAIAR